MPNGINRVPTRGVGEGGLALGLVFATRRPCPHGEIGQKRKSLRKRGVAEKWKFGGLRETRWILLTLTGLMFRCPNGAFARMGSLRFSCGRRGRGGRRLQSRADRRSCIDDDARPSSTRSVGEEKVSEAVLRPPCDQFFELGRRQGIRPSGSAESSRAGTMICCELLQV